MTGRLLAVALGCAAVIGASLWFAFSEPEVPEVSLAAAPAPRMVQPPPAAPPPQPLPVAVAPAALPPAAPPVQALAPPPPPLQPAAPLTPTEEAWLADENKPAPAERVPGLERLNGRFRGRNFGQPVLPTSDLVNERVLRERGLVAPTQ